MGRRHVGSLALVACAAHPRSRRARRQCRATRCRCSTIRSAWRACPPPTAPPVCATTPPSRHARSSEPTAAGSMNSGPQSISDIEEFWSTAYGETFDGDFTPTSGIHLVGRRRTSTACSAAWTRFGLVNAGFCFDDKTIGWDRGELLPSLRRANGDMAVTMVLAHEYGHAIQHQADLVDDDTPTLVGEQQADCLAGVYMRWVAEGNSPRFTLNTGDGLNNLLAAMIAFRDPLLDRERPRSRCGRTRFGIRAGVGVPVRLHRRRRRPAERIDMDGDRRSAAAICRCCCPTTSPANYPSPRSRCSSIVDALGILFEPANPPEAELRVAGLPRRPDTPTRLLLPGDQHHHRRPRGARGDRKPRPTRRTAVAWSPATTPPTRSWCRATCRRSSSEHGGVALTPPRPRCAPRA